MGPAASPADRLRTREPKVWEELLVGALVVLIVLVDEAGALRRRLFGRQGWK